MADQELTVDNVEQFAQDAIKKYKENGMFLDSIVWQKVINLLKEKYMGEAVRIRTINDSVDLVEHLISIDKHLINDKEEKWELEVPSGNKFIWQKKQEK